MKSLKDLYVLIAEDDADDGEILTECFQKHDSFQKVELVKNGKLLLEHLRKDHAKKPDMILTDINMPIMNGIEASEEIFKDPELKDIPIFVYSSANNPHYETRCREIGCIDFFIKPFELAEYEEIPYKLVYQLRNKFGSDQRS